MFRSRFLAVATAFAVSCMSGAARVPAGPRTVVVELFTSEGCSSCPPADDVLADLARPNAVDGVLIIPLGLHVDYWNELGWKDRFSSAQYSQRQQQYAQLFNSDQVYTPQMIVDGTEQFVGSDKQQALMSIAHAADQPHGTIAIKLSANSPASMSLNLSIDGIQRNGNAPIDVMLVITEDGLSTNIPRGENAGRTLHHTAVVRNLSKVATIQASDALPFSASAKIMLQPDWKKEDLHVVAFAQDAQSGRILAAGLNGK